MKSFTYAAILFFTVIVCFIASFDRRIRFTEQWLAFIKAALIVAVPFILWDVWFTAMGVWWFNTNYTLGLVIGGLPVEEWLFFVCIPFSCVFTYFTLDKFFKWEWLSRFNRPIAALIIAVCATVAFVYSDRIYTLVTATAAVVTMVWLHGFARVRWIGKATLVYMILMLGFIPVNGILTGSMLDAPIVNYNPDEFLGIRMFTIPIEDAVYGYTQFMATLYFFFNFQIKR